MFLRVSSLACASVVERNTRRGQSLARPSTRCGVVYPHRPRSNISSRHRLRGNCRARRGAAARTASPRRSSRTSRRAAGRCVPRPRAAHATGPASSVGYAVARGRGGRASRPRRRGPASPGGNARWRERAGQRWRRARRRRPPRGRDPGSFGSAARAREPSFREYTPWAKPGDRGPRRLLTAVLGCVAATHLAAQQPGPAPLPVDTAHAESTPPPPAPPTPEQERYLLGLRSANRGIAQLKDGVDRVIRTQTSQDTVRQRRAGHRLAGLCGAARSFLVSGRSSMRPTVYDPPTPDGAHRLTLQVATLIAYIPSCETVARATPKKAAQDLAGRITAFEGAFKDFRVAIGVLRPTDSSKTPTRQ